VSLDRLVLKFHTRRIEWLLDNELLQRSIGIEDVGMKEERYK
jgi:hypothetical protein